LSVFPTFWKESGGAGRPDEPTQKPAISKFIVALNQLYPVSATEIQFVGRASSEIVCFEG
jgi:hypothetical protein